MKILKKLQQYALQHSENIYSGQLFRFHSLHIQLFGCRLSYARSFQQACRSVVSRQQHFRAINNRICPFRTYDTSKRYMFTYKGKQMLSYLQSKHHACSGVLSDGRASLTLLKGETYTSISKRWYSSDGYHTDFEEEESTGSTVEDLECEEADELEYGNYVREFCAIPGMGHRVMVIQPDIKSGSRRYAMTTKELKLEETCALVSTLSNWRVKEKKIVRTDKENCKEVFGTGNFNDLISEIKSNKSISAVVIGIDRLTGLQINFLQTTWGLPVFDRYMLVLQIFKEHAQSPEAKLQVALAEIPYIRSRLIMIQGGYDAGVSHLVGGQAPLHMDQRRLLLQRRETKLKNELAKLHSRRQEIRLTRARNSVPTVAVVGYTNCGKTTLIKALTEDPNLIPENHLFATLDVSAHEGLLASSLKVTYIDTVGFISDMPITLLDAFRATLEDALFADVVLHIRDASHPDKRLQIVSVLNTLRRLLSEDKMENMLEIYNKVDLISKEEMSGLEPGILQISAVKGFGLKELGKELEKKLLAATGHLRKTFRIPNNLGILTWLQKEAAVESALADPRDAQFLLVKVIISKPAYGKFQARFYRKTPALVTS